MQTTWSYPRPTYVSLLITAGVVFFRLLRILDGAFLYDDAFITFRYAANIANGLGFVYNVGDRVLGTTTPAWTLILTIPQLIGFSMIKASMLLGIASDVITCNVLYRLFGTERSIGIWASLIWMVFPPAVLISIGGMETSFFVMLSLVTLHLVARKNYNPILRLAAPIALLTRPEGIIAYAISIADIFRSVPRKMSVWITTLSAPIAWGTFSFLYFGSLIPHSIIAKRANADHVSSLLSLLVGIFPGETIVLFPFAVGGLILLARRRNVNLPVLWSLTIIVAYCLVRPKMWVWYYLPMQLGVVIAAAVGIDAVISLLSRIFGSMRRIARQRLTAVAILLTLAVATYFHLPSHWDSVNEEAERYRSLAAYVRAETSTGESVLMMDIGYVGFYSDRKVLDAWGLTWRQALDFEGTTAERIPEIAKVFLPEIVIVPLNESLAKPTIDDEWFQRHYVPSRVFAEEPFDIRELGKSDLPSGWSSQYIVYKRVDSDR